MVRLMGRKIQYLV